MSNNYWLLQDFSWRVSYINIFFPWLLGLLYHIQIPKVWSCAQTKNMNMSSPAGPTTATSAAAVTIDAASARWKSISWSSKIIKNWDQMCPDQLFVKLVSLQEFMPPNVPWTSLCKAFLCLCKFWWVWSCAQTNLLDILSHTFSGLAESNDRKSCWIQVAESRKVSESDFAHPTAVACSTCRWPGRRPRSWLEQWNQS